MTEVVDFKGPKNDNPEVEALADAAAFKEALAITNRHKFRSNFWGILAIAGNYAAIAACIVISEHISTRLDSKGQWAGYILMALVISSRLRAFEHMVHEASHNNLFTVPRAHEWFEFTYAFPVFRLLKVFRTLHLEHHKYLGDPVRDADVVRFIDYGFIADVQMSASRKTWLMFGLPFTGWFHYEYINTLFIEFWAHPSCYPSKLIYWITVLAAVHLSDNWAGFGWYYVVPWLGILPVTRWWAELGEHLGMDMTGQFGNSRTNDGFWQRWWIHPFNDGLHAAHHLNSQVPWYRLRVAHTQLMSESRAFREKNVIANSMWETFSQIYTRPTIVKERVEGVRAEWNNGLQMWAKKNQEK
ncbi:fatty acid desaturase-domain-containing protein [Mycena metata]|uniref:Fatty acid desaturase-domain-containing protein n=1 Tax=Mycena metata TaxID=1033252 RepID=A0AAD7II12_9AGAR|nr:fatty acid desaturase-domain-containing protein [Mycena metata]